MAIGNSNNRMRRRRHHVAEIVGIASCFAFCVLMSLLAVPADDHPMLRQDEASSSSSPPSHKTTAGGLLRQSKILLQSVNEAVQPTVRVEHHQDEDTGAAEEPLDSHDPANLLPLRKVLSDTSQVVQQETQAQHDQVKGHVFGENRTASEALEKDPPVTIRDH